ncbi:MAG: exodeoxyribonuclease VII small subunit [Rubripirellula sp.]|nr:exodeoxyribonuclease VII small subunit [Rubripirellula sp.]
MAKKKASSPKTTSPKPKKPVDFESSLAEVEQIVRQLETGELNLTESLGQYELGIKRLKQCHQVLEAAEQRVSQLAGFDADGNPIQHSLDDSNPPSSDPASPPIVDDKPGLF